MKNAKRRESYYKNKQFVHVCCLYMQESIVFQNDIKSNIENISLIARNALAHIADLYNGNLE